jgi:hypothetical protein
MEAGLPEWAFEILRVSPEKPLVKVRLRAFVNFVSKLEAN